MIARTIAPVSAAVNRDPAIRWERWLFAALLVLHLLPVWAFRFAPTQDGPAHLSMAAVLRAWDTPDGSLLHEYFLANEEAIPNWFIFFLLAKVLAFLPLPAAEKVLLSAYVVLLPLSVRFALGAIRPRSRFLAFLAFPFTYNFLLNLGFYNFCFSLAAFFFALGYWLKHRGKLGPGRTAVFALLVLWVYFCHPISLVVLAATVGTLASWRFVLGLRRSGFARGVRRWLFAPLAAFLPALALVTAFLSERLGGRVTDMTAWDKLRQLATLYSLVSLDRSLAYLSFALTLLLTALTLATLARRSRRRRLLWSDGFLLVATLLVILYFAAPNEMSGGGFVTHRLNLFPFLIAILWLGTFAHPRRVRVGVPVAAAAIALGLLGMVSFQWARLDSELAEYVAVGERIEPNSTVLALSFDNGGTAYRVWPFVHAQGHIAARKPLVDLTLYQGNEDYFPRLYRPERNPFVHIAAGPTALEAEPPDVEFLTYPQRTGGTVDYVLLWRPGESRSIFRQLAAGYERVHTSPRGLAQLYRRRDAVR